jgi:hypothetical protein
MARQRIPTPPGAQRVEVGWSRPETEEDFRVVGFLYPAYRGCGERGYSLGEPPEPAHLDLVAVIEDKPGGIERPELLPLVEADLDDLTAEAEEEAAERETAALEDRADAEREERRLER